VNSPHRSRAQVLISHGAVARVRLADGVEVQARAAGRKLQFVCGDEVDCQYDALHAQWQLQEIAPRRSALFRTNARGRPELVAANLTCLVVVLAPLPEPDLFVVDRYLAAAHSARIAALLVANKADLAFSPSLQRELAAYTHAGYEQLPCAAQAGTGLQALQARLRHECAMLVGQSGVGKSSLLRALVPGCDAAIGELLKNDAGRHTTSVSCLHELPDGGALIDSPGVRDFAPALEQLDSRTLGFAEVAQYAPQCRFADCAHLQEPDCAVQLAVAAGGMSARRYESYRRLHRLHKQLRELVPRGRRGR